jgi:hypothetical protein
VFFKVLATVDGECDMDDNHIPGEEMAFLLEVSKILSSILVPVTG